MDQWKKVAWSDEPFFFRSGGWPDACVIYGERMAAGCTLGKKAGRRRQCFALDSVLLETLTADIHVDITLTLLQTT